MKSIMDREKIKWFAQEVLGCGCPEEVFQHIDCSMNFKLDGLNILYRLNIGNKLLVYVFPLHDPASIKEMLPQLIAAGKKERDSGGFNRFRLVLANEHVEAVKRDTEEVFRTMQVDDRFHLHVLPMSRIPQF